MPLWRNNPSNSSQLFEWYMESTYHPDELVLLDGNETKAKESIISYAMGRCAKITFPVVGGRDTSKKAKKGKLLIHIVRRFTK